MFKKTEQQIIEELLESDDELPLDYFEEPDIPAYLDNRRFQTMKFDWIDTNFSKYYHKSANGNGTLSSLWAVLNENVVHKKTENLKVGEKAMLFNGVLSQQDIFCLRCLEPTSSDATLLWFVNFLMYKDLQADFDSLKSCLVHTMFENAREDINKSEKKKYKFDIVIKNK